MLLIAKISFLSLLIVCFYLFIRHIALMLTKSSTFMFHFKQLYLSYRIGVRLRKVPILNRIYVHLSELLEATYRSLKTQQFIGLSAILVLTGVCLGAFLFQSMKGIFVLSMVLGGMPYLWIRIALINLQMKTRIEFMPALEVFYEHYVRSLHKNIRMILRECLDGSHMQQPMNGMFEQLYRNLIVGKDEETSLRFFSMSLNSIWGDHFVHILHFGLLEGVDITDNLRELVQDMRQAQLANQRERNRLLEIRIANFSPILFLVIFLVVNFNLNPENAYRYYVSDPVGREMLLDALLLIFASFLMGVYLSMRRL